jgi:curved DNA-binding protein CbpA
MRNPYDVLEVSKAASAAEITSTFCKRVRNLRADPSKYDPTVTCRIDELCAAYQVIGAESKRKAFDRGEILADGKPRLDSFEGIGAGDPPALCPAPNFDDVIDQEFTEVPGDEAERAPHVPYPFDSPPKPAPYRRWSTWILPLVVAIGALIYFRQGNQPAQNRATCGTSVWRTNITLDHSRPELASTTLHSRNAIGPQPEPRCVDISFACLNDGPYFELRLGSSGARIKETERLLVKVTGEDVNVSVSGLISAEGNAFRISEKTAVEVLASVLNDTSFDIPLTLADGEHAVAQFDALDLFPAIRPVLITCKMRFFRSAKEGTNEGDYDQE